VTVVATSDEYEMELKETAMQLSLEEFESLLRSVAPPGARRPSDKRKHTRIEVEARVTIVPLETSDPRPVCMAVTDVSRMGVALAHETAFPIGQQLIVCLTTSDPSRTSPIVSIVRRVNPHQRLGFEMGCEFLCTDRKPVATESILKGLEDFQFEQMSADAAEAGIDPPRRNGVFRRAVSFLRGK
jgi:hypothetical protein